MTVLTTSYPLVDCKCKPRRLSIDSHTCVCSLLYCYFPITDPSTIVYLWLDIKMLLQQNSSMCPRLSGFTKRWFHHPTPDSSEILNVVFNTTAHSVCACIGDCKFTRAIAGFCPYSYDSLHCELRAARHHLRWQPTSPLTFGSRCHPHRHRHRHYHHNHHYLPRVKGFIFSCICGGCKRLISMLLPGDGTLIWFARWWDSDLISVPWVTSWRDRPQWNSRQHHQWSGIKLSSFDALRFVDPFVCLCVRSLVHREVLTRERCVVNNHFFLTTLEGQRCQQRCQCGKKY